MLSRVREAAEDAKIRLSTETEVSIRLPFLAANFSFEYKLTRSELERLARPVIARTREHCLRALADAKIEPNDLDHDVIAAADIVHLTGITAALGDTARAALHHAITLARRGGATISFDVNYRATLWSTEQAAPVLSRIAAAVDLIVAGPEEAELILGWEPTAGTATVGGVAAARHPDQHLIARGGRHTSDRRPTGVYSRPAAAVAATNRRDRWPTDRSGGCPLMWKATVTMLLATPIALRSLASTWPSWLTSVTTSGASL